MFWLTDHLDMTIAVDWDVTPQPKQTIQDFEADFLITLVLLNPDVSTLRQGSHRLWKSRKTWKIIKKIPCMEKSWNLKKT